MALRRRVGANYGYYTLLMADAVGAGGMVLAAEPNPHLAELLKRNVSVNGFVRSTTFLAKAISERNAGSVSFVVPEGNRSMNGTLCMAAGAGDRVYDVRDRHPRRMRSQTGRGSTSSRSMPRERRKRSGGACSAPCSGTRT
jgi:FkbM family methyltransferase